MTLHVDWTIAKASEILFSLFISLFEFSAVSLCSISMVRLKKTFSSAVLVCGCVQYVKSLTLIVFDMTLKIIFIFLLA